VDSYTAPGRGAARDGAPLLGLGGHDDLVLARDGLNALAADYRAAADAMVPSGAVWDL